VSLENNGHDPVVVVRNLYKEFRRDQNVIPVLSGINLDLPAGDYLALMGPSGSGKTTLLNLMAGLDRPTSGTITVCGRNVGVASEGELARWRSQHIGFIFQLYNLIPVLTAYENVELPLMLTVKSSGPLSSSVVGRSGTTCFHRPGHRDGSDAAGR
jgi:putative ABC transport system ATP-binding protein